MNAAYSPIRAAYLKPPAFLNAGDFDIVVEYSEMKYLTKSMWRGFQQVGPEAEQNHVQWQRAFVAYREGKKCVRRPCWRLVASES